MLPTTGAPLHHMVLPEEPNEWPEGQNDGLRHRRQNSQMLFGGESNRGQGKGPPHSSLSSSPFPLFESFLCDVPFGHGGHPNGRRFKHNN